MKNIVVETQGVKDPVKRSPGFAKKILSDYKLDIVGLCGFGCRYCSSNMGNYLRINREKFLEATRSQTGSNLMPTNAPELTFHWSDVLEKLETQLSKKRKNFGEGLTLVFSMLTDGFSPLLVKEGITESALRMVLEKTSFRIRVLTKNAIVGSDKWIEFFQSYPGRFVVGLSTGTLNDEWARKVEIGTSLPSARLNALNRLQEAGVPTYGMLCPVFPDVLGNGQLDALIDRINPQVVEHVWAEPYNDRINWEYVRGGYDPISPGYEWMTDVYGNRNTARWSEYATDLLLELRERAKREGWLPKLRYLLYEDLISEADAFRLDDLSGVLLQSKPDEEGYSKNRFISKLQRFSE